MPSYRELILGTAGLLHYWPLDEAAGPTAEDDAGGNDGTYGAATTPGAPGVVNDGSTSTQFAFNDDSHVTITGASAPAAPYTLELWMASSSVGGGGPLFTRDGREGLQIVTGDPNPSDADLSCSRDLDGDSTWVTRTQLFNHDAGAHYVAVTVAGDGSTLIYRDGAALSATSFQSGGPDADGVMRIGNTGGPGWSHFGGRIGHVALYGRALTGEEIASRMAPGGHARRVDAGGVRGPRLQVRVGERDLTNQVAGLSFSAADPGGFQACGFQLPQDLRVDLADRVSVRDGADVAWDGRVSEFTSRSKGSEGTTEVACEGFGARLRDDTMSMVYIDQDLTAWRGGSPTRRDTLEAGGFSISEPQVHHAKKSAAPQLVCEIEGDWAAADRPACEALYDAGPGNSIGSVYYAWKRNNKIGSGSAWQWQVYATKDDDTFEDVEGTPDLDSAGPGAGRLHLKLGQRFAIVSFAWVGGAVSGVPNRKYRLQWTRLAVYGNHGLPLRGDQEPRGFYPSDIISHAVSQVTGITPGRIEEASSFIVPQAVYSEPVPPEDIIDEMCDLMGWHWGVWEPESGLDPEARPRFDFHPPPAEATCSVARRACSDMDITLRLQDAYSVAEISWQDPAGGEHLAITRLENQLLADAGIDRTLSLDLGTAAGATAELYGRQVLALTDFQARGAGSITLPSHVQVPGGGPKPAYLLRPGKDRLQILDVDPATHRDAVFRISRLETSIGDDGAPQTRAELDAGSNLVDVVNARLALSEYVNPGKGKGGKKRRRKKKKHKRNRR